MASPGDPEDTILHASAVAWDGAGLLIMGPSGSGKSALALELMAFGAVLIADDRTRVQREGSELILSPAPNIAGLIEARGVGLLTAEYQRDIVARAVVDLGATEADRLPPERNTSVLGVTLPLFHNPGTPSFAAALLQYLKGGRHA